MRCNRIVAHSEAIARAHSRTDRFSVAGKCLAMVGGQASL